MKLCVVLDANNIVTNYGICLDDTHMPFANGTIVHTDLDLDIIEIVGNYKVVDGVLVELTVDDKGEVNTPTQTQDEQIQILKAKSVNLKVALADLTDLVYMQHLDDLLI